MVLVPQGVQPQKLHSGHVVALVRSHMNGLKPFERTIEQTTETMLPSPKTKTAAAVTTSRIRSLRELLHYWYLLGYCLKRKMTGDNYLSID